jgi:hypothetical protein
MQSYVFTDRAIDYEQYVIIVLTEVLYTNYPVMLDF